MAFYITDRKLSKKDEYIEVGTVTELDWLSEENIDKLTQLGCVHKLEMPPLEVLPGWDTRAKALKKDNVMTVEDFLEADTRMLSKAVRKSASTVNSWKRDLRKYVYSLSTPAGYRR